MSDNPVADRLAQQMRYTRLPDPEEAAAAQREVYYQSFDRAVATLTPEKAASVDLHSSYINAAGVWVLRDVGANTIADVRDEESAPPAAPAAPTPVPQRSGVSAKAINAKFERLVEAAATRINSLEEQHKKWIDDIIECVTALGHRVKALETNGAIDSEVMTTLAQLTEKVEDIQQRGFRFVGKYQAPATYRTGDVVAYKDSLWHCVADCKVGERPNTASHKWALMLAGGDE